MDQYKDFNQPKGKEDGSLNLGRHQAQCTICMHPYRHEIEAEWIGWGDTRYIAEQYKVSRDAIYRHAHAFDLFSKRRANIRRVLEKIIERVDTTPMNGSNILSALKAYVQLDSVGQAAKQVPAESPKVSSCSAPEPDGTVSARISGVMGTTLGADQNEEKERQPTETKQLQ